MTSDEPRGFHANVLTGLLQLPHANLQLETRNPELETQKRNLTTKNTKQYNRTITVNMNNVNNLLFPAKSRVIWSAQTWPRTD